MIAPLAVVAGLWAGAVASASAAAEQGPGGRLDAAGALCDRAVALAESAENIPRHLLASVATAESGRPIAPGRSAGPWPWTVMAQGQGRFFATRDDAIDAVGELIENGVVNIDVGCLQINLFHHPEAFLSLEEAFDPLANAAYGAVYLKALFMETGSWPEAVGRYHSATRQFNTAYRQKVLALWNARRGPPARVLRAGDPGARRERGGVDDFAASVNAIARSRSPATFQRGVSTPTLGGEAIDELKARLSTMTPP